MPMKYFKSTDTRVELKDTMKLQKASLDLFASKLGYEWIEECGFYRGGWCAIHYFESVQRGMVNISLRKMQKWHNTSFKFEVESYPWHGEEYLPSVQDRLKFDVQQLHEAIDSTLVVKTNLQWSKKRKELVCVDHQIQFK